MTEERGLVIRDLHVAVDDKEIIKGLSLVVRKGEIHALMGPNGSGKSTLANALMGHPGYTITAGEVLLDGVNLTDEPADVRARHGLFLAFQYPTAVPGVSMGNFLRLAMKAVQGREIPPMEFRRTVQEQMKRLKMDSAFLSRYVNEGFSGGEKKRAEILQLALLRPRYAILDETDSGLDIDALRIVAEGVNALAGPEIGILLITHYQRLLQYIRPQFVHVLVDGRLIRSGGPELAEELEARGYDWIIQHAAVSGEVR
ncbi:MAG: Fe-S cluster assembly ATPase SufC [Chloroflexi bacterium]|nr:Fe-S cluster assembly ATPase SufC [Chloroflexota bacterium]